MGFSATVEEGLWNGKQSLGSEDAGKRAYCETEDDLISFINASFVATTKGVLKDSPLPKLAGCEGTL